MKDPLAVGIVGAGYMGLNHASCYIDNPLCDLMAFFEPHPVAAQKFQSLYPQALYCESLVELGSYCEAVSICSPTPFHTSQALELLDYCCDLLIEKPVSDNLADHLLLKDRSSQAKQIIQVGLVEQFNPVVKYIQKNCKNPDFVSLLRVAPFSRRGSDVSVVHDLSVHDIGILLSIFDDPFSSVETLQHNGLSFSTGADINSSVFTFGGDKKALVLTHRASFSKSRQIALSKAGKAYAFDLITQEGQLITKEGGVSLGLPRANPLSQEISSFIGACQGREKPQNDIEFSLKIFRILDGLNKL